MHLGERRKILKLCFDYQQYDRIRGVLVIIFDDVRTHGDDVVFLIECMLIRILIYFMIFFSLNAQIGEELLF